MQRDETYLLDILIAARRVEEYTREKAWDEFRRSNLLQDAVIRQFEIIGEASRLVSQEFKDAHPEIPWRQMMGMRNRLIHEYFRVDVEIVWDASQNDIGTLISAIEPFIPPQ